ncbi:MAG: hypothetical protein ABJG78_09790 [Cyclobacteriaceae bacterium]
MRIFLLLFMLLPIITFSQKRRNQKDTSSIISQLNRIEFELTKDRSEFYVVPGDEDGLLVVEETEGGGSGTWKLHLVDTAFNLVWSREEKAPAEGNFLGYDYFGGKFYLLFNKSRFRSQELVVLELNADSKANALYEITTVFPVNITHFESVGETLLIGGYANFRPVVITYNIHDKKPRVVPGFYDSKNDMLDIVVDKESKFFTVILSERMRNKKSTVRVKTFTEKGDLVQDNLLDPGEKKSLLDGASTTFANGLQYLAGTHSKKSPLYSQGFYLSKFINGTQQFNKYYAFADLNNFFNHLKPKKENRIKGRIERKRQKGKVKKFNYRLLVHKILRRGDHYVMIAEAYYPRYNYGSTGNTFRPTSFGGFGNNSSGRGNQSFNPDFLGYKYTHAVVIGFDVNCNIIWDHTFKIEDKQSFSLDENVMVSGAGNEIVLTYLEENEIRSKVVDGDEIVEGRTFNPVRLSFVTDELKTKDPQVEGIEKWYGDTMFAYGVQNIKNENGVAGKVYRKVFYLNKIRFDLNREVN